MLERCSQVGFLALTKSENSRDVKVWPLRFDPEIAETTANRQAVGA